MLEHVLFGIFDAEVGDVFVVTQVVTFLEVARQIVAVGAEEARHVGHAEVTVQEELLHIHHLVKALVQSFLHLAESVLIGVAVGGGVVVGIVKQRVIEPLVGVDEPVLAQGALHIVEVEGGQRHLNDAVGLEKSKQDVGPSVVEKEISANQDTDYHREHQRDKGEEQDMHGRQTCPLEEIADEGVTGEARLVQYHDAEQDGVDGIEEEGEVV